MKIDNELPLEQDFSLPLVSVIIPMYNHERFIVKCLDSITEDDYPHKEIIILDDGSTDASLLVVTNWYRRNAHRFHGRFEVTNRDNRGITRTLNDLVEKAAGDFIAILASDDYLLKGGIRARLDYLQSHPAMMAVIGDCIVANQDDVKIHDSGIEGHHRGRKKYLADEKLISYEIVFHWCIPGPVFMARRELYSTIGKYDESISVEDRDFYLRLAAKKLLGFVDFPVAAYRVHTGSFSKDSRRHLSYNRAMLVSVRKNHGSFSGIKKTYLFFLGLRLQGLISRQENRDQIKGHLYRILGHYACMLLKMLYDFSVILMQCLKLDGSKKNNNSLAGSSSCES